MVDPYPQPYTTASPVLVNYNWADVQSGVGYRVYYLIESEDDTGTDYHLTTQTDYSNSVSVTVNASTFDEDFDLTMFALPQELEGTALISLPIKVGSGTSPEITVELYKWDGSSETIIGSAVVFDTAADTAKMLYFNYDIPYTHFSVGDVLRLRLKIVQSSAVTAYVGIDPANRTDSNLSITTTSKISIPYRTNQ